jgi:DNA invertase Pin-like site-specific DNA recombinase
MQLRTRPQLSALKAAGCDRIYEDTMSGSKAGWLGLAKVLEVLREGDTLIM